MAGRCGAACSASPPLARGKPAMRGWRGRSGSAVAEPSARDQTIAQRRARVRRLAEQGKSARGRGNLLCGAGPQPHAPTAWRMGASSRATAETKNSSATASAAARHGARSSSEGGPPAMASASSRSTKNAIPRSAGSRSTTAADTGCVTRTRGSGRRDVPRARRQPHVVPRLAAPPAVRSRPYRRLADGEDQADPRGQPRRRRAPDGARPPAPAPRPRADPPLRPGQPRRIQPVLATLHRGSCDGYTEAAAFGSGWAAGDAIAGASAGGKVGASSAVLGGDRAGAVQRGCGGPVGLVGGDAAGGEGSLRCESPVG
jgi:hypothetical protein